MQIRGVEIYPGRPCPNSGPEGCSDYANRPKDPCIEFNCGWVTEGSPLPDWMKPNESGVIVIFNKLEWQGLAVDLAVPVGGAIPDDALAWLKAFAQHHMRPLVYTEQIVEDGRYQKEQQLFAYGPPAFQEHITSSHEAGLRLW